MCSHIYRRHRDVTVEASFDTTRADNHTAQESTSSGILMDLSVPPSLSHDVDQLLHRYVHEKKLFVSSTNESGTVAHSGSG